MVVLGVYFKLTSSHYLRYTFNINYHQKEMRKSVHIKVIPARESIKKHLYLIEDARDNIRRAISMRLDILHDLQERGKLSNEVVRHAEQLIRGSQIKLLEDPIHDVKRILDYWLIARDELSQAVDEAKRHLEEYPNALRDETP